MRAMFEGVKSAQKGGGLGHVEESVFSSSAMLVALYFEVEAREKSRVQVGGVILCLMMEEDRVGGVGARLDAPGNQRGNSCPGPLSAVTSLPSLLSHQHRLLHREIYEARSLSNDRCRSTVDRMMHPPAARRRIMRRSLTSGDGWRLL